MTINGAVVSRIVARVASSSSSLFIERAERRESFDLG